MNPIDYCNNPTVNLITHRYYEICKKNNINVVAYYSLIHNNWAEINHPDWKMIEKNGKSARENGGRYGFVCPNNGKYREFLEEQIKEMFFGGEISFNDEVYITNARHKAALEEADKSLDLVRNSIEMGMPEDFFSIDLMNAYENLGKILGESVGEDLVNEIFSKFCMGK